MKKLLFYILIALLLIPSGVLAQGEDFVPKFDGTKYYLLVYDGNGNEKVLDYDPNAAWNEGINYADYFDGSDNQLWTFEAVEAEPGYLNVKNEALSDDHYLKSWNWLAYMEPQVDGREGNEATDPELWYTFKHAFDGWQILETIQKEPGLSGLDYTPGADALNLDPTSGVGSFDVKSEDITQDNAEFKVFKIVEFDPFSLLENTIERGQDMYDTTEYVNDTVRYQLFYALEKAREARVFGSSSELLQAQEKIDSLMGNYEGFVELYGFISQARTFISNSPAGQDVKDSFNEIVDLAEGMINADTVDYPAIIQVLKDRLAAAEDLVEAIVSGQQYHDQLPGDADTRLNDGMLLSIDGATTALDDARGDASSYLERVSHIQRAMELVTEIMNAQDMVDAADDDFQDAKDELNTVIEEAITILNNSGSQSTDLADATAMLQDAEVVFQKALEAGDITVELLNPGFESEFEGWQSYSDTDWLPYTEDNGVDGSKNMTVWQGADYTFRTSQSLKELPAGTYEVSVMAQVSNDSTIALFATNGTDTTLKPLAFEQWALTERTLQIEVVGDSLEFGIKGVGLYDSIPANHWGTFDNFAVKWMSSIEVENPGFENEFAGWTSTTGTDWLPYTEDAGVDGSKNMTIWNSADYDFRTTQTLNGLKEGIYQLSVMSAVNNDSTIQVFAASAEDTTELPLAFEAWDLTKRKLQVHVTGGSLVIGVKGAGQNDSIPANHWGKFDNFEVDRLPDMPLVNGDFEDDLNGWSADTDTDWLPYIENKGVGGSKNMTIWNNVDYHIKAYQQLSGLINGNYEVSLMTQVSNDSTISLYASSGGVEEIQPLPFHGWELAGYNVGIDVTDNTLELGVRGSGDGNFIPANHWGTFDNFELKIKTILPVYDTASSPAKSAPRIITDIRPNEEPELSVHYWQKNRSLNIRSDQTMERVTVYSITGARIRELNPHANLVEIPLNRGVYIVRLVSGEGKMDTRKVVIR